MPSDHVLELESVTKKYGALTVTDDVDLRLTRGVRHALIGPNGAGKTTLFNLIAGRTPTTSGRILLNGEDITRKREEVRCRKGIGRTFQHSSLFNSLDPVQNTLMALRRRDGTAKSFLPTPRRERKLVDEAQGLLERVGLDPTGHKRVEALSHGQRRQLEIAMALAVRPDVILFDEPTAGMSAAETSTFSGLVAGLPPELSIVLIEHDLDVVFSLADTVTVLATGKVIAEGDPGVIQGSQAVQDAYLGTSLQEVFL